ncbi:SDR family NAD(P)-dependent oxidoreductase [Streptomyces sp. NBC_01224]|uniref:SDR family NAD(P)-dependent oxidoreductase n=1 Tax=Streptomyces sp. NPDC059970 TaxID=3347019 RepID=UPI002E121FA4|nr:SDR family NAD(P)-dependent oxidoreductase [Streptomyces sp. NBC_01224]
MTTEAAIYPDLSGRSVCVTGAARGLGLAMADAFVRAGCHVLLLATAPPAALQRLRCPRRVGQVRNQLKP